jgi:hypothetical protein
VLTVVAVTACTTSHVDNPTVNAPPSLSYTATASGGASPLPNPCTLASAASIRQALGGVVSMGTAPSLASQCAWAVTGSVEFGAGRVVVYFPPAQSVGAFQAAKAVPGAEAIPGLGDSAFYQPTTGALTVLVGGHQFVVQGDFPTALGDSHAGALEAALAGLARTATPLV